jgi:PilZ domain
MTEESESGLAYLMALKGPATETSAGLQESTSAGKPQQDGEKFSGPDKRRSRRFQCEGSVDIRAEGSVVRTWATFSDISLHGCYVEAQATYPVGSLLHMKLDANGIRVESHGIVRVSYPYLAMGIAFADMTPQSTAELRRLLASVSRPNLIMGAGTASSLPSAAREAAPAVNDSVAALQALIEFFESRQVLMRDDFLRILKKSGK